MADKNEEVTLDASTEKSPKAEPVSDEEQLLKAVQDGRLFIYSLTVRNVRIGRCFVKETSSLSWA